MPNMTRAHAQALLNKREMALYDDSRLNGLRKLDPAGVSKRVALAREARDRARDLLQRQKLALRAATGSKRGTGDAANQRSKDKVELLADILVRFRDHAPVARKRAAAGVAGSPAKRSPALKKSAASRATKKAATKKASTKKVSTKKAATEKTETKKAATQSTATKKTATKKTATKKTATKKTATNKTATKKAATRKIATKKTPAKPSEQTTARGSRGKASTPAATTAPKMPTARKALANTRKLLRAKQAEARAPKPWQSIGTSTGTGQVPPHEGYQSPEAAVRAAELHDAEMHRPAQLGAVSSHVRRAQGRRDAKGGA